MNRTEITETASGLQRFHQQFNDLGLLSETAEAHISAAIMVLYSLRGLAPDTAQPTPGSRRNGLCSCELADRLKDG